MWSEKFSLSSITTPRCLAVFEGVMVDEPNWKVKLRRNEKEIRWNRIKRTSSRMTGKDEFRDFCLREWREICERVYCHIPVYLIKRTLLCFSLG